jgi:glycosyltransferase involved in cell wall biosynthesis
MLPLSAVLITKDEEERLPDALASVRFCDEIVVVDAGSTDRTRDIAQEAGARVLVKTPWPGYALQRNAAVEAARHDWVLCLDADERVTPALRDEIQAARAQGFPGCDGYRMPRVAFYLGRWIRGTDWYPDRQLRLFDRRRGRWRETLIHESVRVEGRVGRLRGELEHFTYRDVSHHLRPSTSTHRCGPNRPTPRGAGRAPSPPSSTAPSPSSATTCCGAASRWAGSAWWSRRSTPTTPS